MIVNIQSPQIQNYRDLMRTLKQLLEAAWGKNNVRFVAAYPKSTDATNIKTPFITYSVVSKAPGEFKSASELKPRYRETIFVEEKGKQIPIELYGQMFDYRILFEIWADDGDSADELVERFQLFMAQYAGFLKKKGVTEILFDEMTGDEASGKWKTDLIRRRIIYRIRLEEVTQIKCPITEEIVISTLLHDSSYNMVLNLVLLEQDPRRISLYEDQVTIKNSDNSQTNEST